MSATLLAAPPLAGTAAAPRSARRVWAGRILTGLTLAFLTFDVGVKFATIPGAAAATAQLGWSPAQAPLLGAIGLVCLVLYAVPRTAVLGAVLWTGYLGGAIATQLRLGNPLFTHLLFPVYVAALLWVGLYLRDARVRALVRTMVRPAR